MHRYKRVDVLLSEAAIQAINERFPKPGRSLPQQAGEFVAVGLALAGFVQSMEITMESLLRKEKAGNLSEQDTALMDHVTNLLKQLRYVQESSEYYI